MKCVGIQVGYDPEKSIRRNHLIEPFSRHTRSQWWQGQTKTNKVRSPNDWNGSEGDADGEESVDDVVEDCLHLGVGDLRPGIEGFRFKPLPLTKEGNIQSIA